MKRNITINMCGRLFAIDEDAYEVLSTYETSLRRYFQGREGGDEIADDLEERMAELLEELRGDGEAVSIQHVQEVIHRLGNPKQMDGDEEAACSAAEATSQAAEQAKAVHNAVEQEGSAPRRLYRNLEDRKWMGVLSGFAAYFGGDPLWWRIGYVSVFVLTLFTGLIPAFYSLNDPMLSLCLLLLIAYIALAVLMPVAQTPEERLRMKGRAVTPESLAQEVQGDTLATRQAPRDEHLGCIGGFFRLITFLFQLIVGVLGGALAAAALAGLIFLAYLLFLPSQVNMLNAPEWIADLLPAHGLTLVAIIAGIVALFVLLYALIHALLSACGLVPPMGRRLSLSLLAVELVALTVSAATGFAVFSHVIEKQEAQWGLEQMHDGVFIRDVDWEYLQDKGWTLAAHDSCNERYTSRDEHWTGERDRRYLDSYDEQHRQRYTALHAETLQPGTYCLTATGRANGTGAVIFLTDAVQGLKLTAEIPVCDNRGGGIWEEACAQRDSLEQQGAPVPDDLRRIAEVNDGRGYGWSRMEIGPFTLKETSTVSYGVSTDPAVSGRSWLGQWFSACDFHLVEVREDKVVEKVTVVKKFESKTGKQ